MATLAEGGRISLTDVDEEIARCREAAPADPEPRDEGIDVDALLG